MIDIQSRLPWCYFRDSQRKAEQADCLIVRTNSGYPVTTYQDLAARIAELQFRNRDYFLLFRGQSKEYRRSPDQATVLKPSILRGRTSGETYLSRFEILATAEQLLIDRLQKYDGLTDDDRRFVIRHRITQWAMLQHYEVCKTPLLDVTQSLSVAVQFATRKHPRKGVVYVLAVPSISGAVTASAEAGLQIVRLASMCPPNATRPHLQEGYLLGDYPDIANHDQKQKYLRKENDCAGRLIAKFRFEPEGAGSKSQNWPANVPDLFPADDPFLSVMNGVLEDLREKKS